MISLSTIGILGCLVLLLLLFLSVPVGFALMLVGSIGFVAATGNLDSACHLLVSVTLDNFSKYDLCVIPLFILMGQIAFHAGISRRMFDTAYVWIGKLPGGIALATMTACVGFCSICGSGPASAATMTAVAMPEMHRHRFRLDIGAGIIAAGSSLGILIPPSVVIIVYAIITENSPARLFAAGIMPSLMIILMFFVYINWVCSRHPEICPKTNLSVTWKQRFISLLGVLDTLVLFMLVMLGMLVFRWFTPTEAAAVGAGGSLLIALCRRSLPMKALQQTLRETIRTSTMVLIIVTGALIFGRFLALTGLTFDIAETFTSTQLPRWYKMATIMFFLIVSGCFMDALALIMLTIPIFLPVIKALQYDTIWFGVMAVLLVQLGVITPPVGVNVYVVSGIERSVPMQKIFKCALPFALILVIGAILLMLFPQIAMALPDALYKM